MQNANDLPLRRRKKALLFPIVAAAIALLLGAVVMWLWNAILPALLSVARIGYWQAVGLLVLCRILFGRYGRDFGGGAPGSMRGPGGAMRQKWMAMSEEERRAFKEKWRGGKGGGSPSGSQC